MILFVLVTAITYLIYYIFIIRKYDEKGKRIEKKKRSKKISKITTRKKKEFDQAKYPVEVELFIYKYKIDLKKVNFRKMVKTIGFVCSIDIAFIMTVLNYINTDNTLILLVIGALMVIPVILISYSLLGKYFKKKGLTKNV